MKLYELSDQYEALKNMISDGLIPTEAIADTLEAVEGEYIEKVDNIACIYKGLLAEAEALKAEEKSLEGRRKTKENNAESLKRYLSDNLLRVGTDRVETTRNYLSFRKSTALSIEDEEAFISWAEQHNADALLIYGTPKPDKKAITEAIRGGEDIPGAALLDKQNLQIR